MSILKEHPFSPTGTIVRVRQEFIELVSGQIGHVYAHSTLALRRSAGGSTFYAPVVAGPGGVLYFTWPEQAMDVAWMETVSPQDGFLCEGHRPQAGWVH
ncbi:MAG: hypothetical protein AAGD13_22905 [Pseudomonadota bacterium]